MSALAVLQPASPFEELPIEIHIVILHSMSSPKDLSATIRASPTALSAFLSCREAILFSVLESHISPEIFYHYLALVTVPKYTNFNFVAPFDPDLGYDKSEPYLDEDHDESRWQAWCDFGHNLYKNKINIANHVRSGGDMGEENQWGALRSKVSTKEQVETFKQHVQSLLALYGTIERFTKDFQAFSFSTAEGCQAGLLVEIDLSNPPHDAAQWPPLSPGEQVRLQRGLLRYELCCRLFGIPFMLWNTDVQKDIKYSEDDPYCIIKDLMSSWELQEVLAIRAYVQKKYILLHWNTESELSYDIDSLDQRSWNSDSEDAENGAHNQQKVSENKDWRPLATVMAPSKHWVDAMSRLGLVALQYVLSSDDESKFELHGFMVNWVVRRPTRCILDPDELHSHSDWVYPQGHQRGQATASLGGANPVFRAAQIQKGKLYRKSDEILEHGTRQLQELGWVFWEDSVRISTLHLPSDEDDQRHPKNQLARYFRKDVRRLRFYEEGEVIDLIQDACVKEEDWNNIIVPKYGLRTPGSFGAPPMSETPWLDVW